MVSTKKPVKNAKSVKSVKPVKKEASKTAKKHSTEKKPAKDAKSSSKSATSIIAQGHMVSVDYVGTLSNGEEFDNSKEHGPISFIVGQGQVIKGFDDAVIGMKVNEKKKFNIKKEDAYGDINPALLHKVPLDKLPPDVKSQVKIGGFLVLQSPAGHQIPAKVTAIDATEVTLDMNHPLAGKDLTFDITIKSITEVDKDALKSCCGGDCGCDDKDGKDLDCCGGDCNCH